MSDVLALTGNDINGISVDLIQPHLGSTSTESNNLERPGAFRVDWSSAPVPSNLPVSTSESCVKDAGIEATEAENEQARNTSGPM